ncbi:MAG: glycoside hydrolase family 28 protein [Defluviitaleaceae bacterium]|nr:glycoside hydrolase family 28 protein [Defluviitaleaceae bacterium]
MESYTLLKVTAFGFIFELNSESCYFAQNGDFEIFLNGQFYGTANTNVISLLSLGSDMVYNVAVKNFFDEDIVFSVNTLKPGFVINVKDYNAAGDGVACDTAAINLAIYAAPAGSTVYIPKGKYMVDQVLLKSNVDIHLESGAVLCHGFDREKLAILKGYQKNYDHKDVTINASWEGHPLDCYASLIYGKDIENVHIYGEGVIDGNGDIGGFWHNPKVKNKAFRPKNVFLVNCRNIEISGLTSMNSASWNIHPFYCDNVSLRCLKIKSIEESPNTDGINPESCNNIDIIGCHFSVGDDCIAIKAGKYYMSIAHPRFTKNVNIRQCFMEKGHGGVVIGSEMSCGVYNVSVEKCLFRETDRGLRIKTRRGRGKDAIVDGIIFSKVEMQKVRHCFVVNMFYNCDPDGKSNYVRDKEPRPRDEFTPTIKNISLTEVIAREITGSAVFIYGLPESPVCGISVEKSILSFVDEAQRIHECPAMMDDFDTIKNLGIFIKNAQDVKLEENEIIGEAFCMTAQPTRKE